MKDVIEIERNIIGAYIDNEDLFQKCEHLVAESLFSDKVNRMTFKLIKALRNKGIKPDNVIINKELRIAGVKAASIPLYACDSQYKIQPEQYVTYLFEENRIKKYLLPAIASTQLNLEKGSGSPLDLMMDLKNKINDVELVLNNVSRDSSIGDIVDKAIQEIIENKDAKNKTGYSTTLTKLDEITGGLLPGIFVIGALPGMGKTSLLINIITHNGIKNNVPIVFFSLEMSATQIIKNCLSNMYDINTMAIRDGGLDDEQLKQIKESKNRFGDNIIIDDTSGVTWQYIDAKLTKVRKKFPIDQQIIVMVDYLQLMGNVDEEIRGKTDEAQMAARCKGLMNMWKKHNACIIELTQLGREVAKEMGKRKPRISDAKDSGAIEANANVFILPHRPDYFDANATDEKGNSLKGIVEIIVGKNRGGRVGYVYSNFEGKYSKFTNFNKEQWESGGGII